MPSAEDSPVLRPFLLATAQDIVEDDLVRVEAIRAIPLLDFAEPALVDQCRKALFRLVREDDDWDVGNVSAALNLFLRRSLR